MDFSFSETKNTRPLNSLSAIQQSVRLLAQTTTPRPLMFDPSIDPMSAGILLQPKQKPLLE